MLAVAAQEETLLQVQTVALEEMVVEAQAAVQIIAMSQHLEPLILVVVQEVQVTTVRLKKVAQV
jgi:hypothetical protein